jgi:septal ring factor EnvC (AmiA/AmiB activator)
MQQQLIVSESAAEGFEPLEALESRIEVAIERYRSAQQGQHAAEQEASRLQEIVSEKEDQIVRLTRDLAEAQAERDRVRSRIEALLQRLEAIEE